jgi:hypothetical protein
MKPVFILLMLIMLVSACGLMTPQSSLSPSAETASPSALPASAAAETVTERLGFQGGNIGAGGYMCDGGDGYVYYRSEKAGADSWTLYKARYNGTGKQKLSDAQPQNINVLDGWVYFIAETEESYAIHRIRTDGTDQQKLTESSYGGLYVAESGMYFNMPNGQGTLDVARADLDGGNMQVLIPDAGIAYYFEKNIYYTNASGLFVCSLVTGKIKLLTDSYTHNLAADETGIYYRSVNHNGFVRRDFESGAETVLVTGSEYYAYAAGFVYYTGQRREDWPGRAILRLDLATGETDTLFESTGEYFDSAGEWLGVHFFDDLAGADPLILDQHGAVKGSTESAGEVYNCGGHTYMRGVLRESTVRKGMPLCIAILEDGDAKFWD